MEKEMEQWETVDGVKFLRKIGITTGQVVLDFGANVGHYSIPAAILVGNNGLIYAIDKEQESLNKLEQKANELGLANIIAIKNSGDARISLKDKSIDAALLYDILHYLRQKERKTLYNELHRILKPNGLLSVYPKHVVEDYPLMEFQNMYIDDVKQEIRDSGFLFDRKYCSNMSHDDELGSGCILNFKKDKINSV